MRGVPSLHALPKGAACALPLLLAACQAPQRPVAPLPAPPPVATPAPAPAPTPAPAPPRARDLPLQILGMPDLPGADAALAAFRKSCTALLGRDDQSGLTQRSDWHPACSAAGDATDAGGFFSEYFAAVAVGPEAGAGFATGYYEPEIAGCRQRAPGCEVPIYRRPPDLIEVDLGEFAESLKGRRIRGRVEGQRLKPYPDRAAITAGALAGRGLELAFAADPYEMFFLEIQGSGRLKLADGSMMRIGYDGQNGRDYTAIGRVLVARGDLPSGGAGMAAILGWLRSHPDQAQALLNENRSKIFFRELTGEGPVGAMGVAVTPWASVAADPAHIPLGAPLLVETTLTATGAPWRRLMVAQDTGGAIKGPNRIDLFLGPGAEAARLAGAQSAPARLLILIPKAAAARLVP